MKGGFRVGFTVGDHVRRHQAQRTRRQSLLWVKTTGRLLKVYASMSARPDAKVDHRPGMDNCCLGTNPVPFGTGALRRGLHAANAPEFF